MRPWPYQVLPVLLRMRRRPEGRQGVTAEFRLENGWKVQDPCERTWGDNTDVSCVRHMF